MFLYGGSTPVIRKYLAENVEFHLIEFSSLVLGTIKTATDLLDKRGSIYSSGSRSIMA